MTDLWTNVATYAALEAQLASASTNRAKVLSDAKLDGLALARLRVAWDVRFAQDRRIEEAYEDALEVPEQATAPAPGSGLRTSVIEDPPPRAAPPAPALEASRWAAHASPARPDPWAAVPAGTRHFSGVRGTELAGNLPAGPALPFERSTGAPAPAVAQPVEKQAPPRIVRASAHLSGTALDSDIPLRPVTPFLQSVAPPAPAAEPPGASPALTVDHYALLRAHLVVNGEGDQATWEQFGITEAADKHAVQAGFAARFKQDPALQARFVELVPRLITQLRRQGSGK